MARGLSRGQIWMYRFRRADHQHHSGTPKRGHHRPGGRTEAGTVCGESGSPADRRAGRPGAVLRALGEAADAPRLRGTRLRLTSCSIPRRNSCSAGKAHHPRSGCHGPAGGCSGWWSPPGVHGRGSCTARSRSVASLDRGDELGRSGNVDGHDHEPIALPAPVRMDGLSVIREACEQPAPAAAGFRIVFQDTASKQCEGFGSVLASQEGGMLRCKN